MQIRFLHNPLSFHKNAMGAAKASMAAGRQGRFWDYHDTLFANQKNLEDADLVKFAEELGLDMTQFEKDRKDAEIAKRIDADQASAVKLGASGTPAFFVNGTHVKGAKPFAEFKVLIDAELAKVDAKIAGGVADDNAVYGVIKENNKEAFDLLVRLLPVRKPPPPPAEVWKVSLRGDEAAKGGNKDAAVTIVEWSDFECPFCSKVGPTINQVLTEYGEDVRFVFKHNPLSFHKKALLAAEATIEAQRQGKFWEFHDKLFENQKALERPDLETYATDLGLDVEAFKAALDNGTHTARALLEQADAGEVKASGTPAFFINGRKLTGNSFEDFKTLIDTELKEAKALIKAGTKPADVYGQRIASGKIHKVLESKVNAFTFAGSPMIGKAPAKITITEFSEFQ